MYIQPLLLTMLSGPVEAVSAIRTASGRPESAGRTEVPRGDSPSLNPRDTVEISREAEAQLVGQLSQEARREVEQLKARDREVRAHEQAHMSAAGPYARGGAGYSYQTGPDGRQYAVGGEVGIDTSPVADDPEATIQKAQVIRAAALAPANPSSQDRSVAAAATKMETQARQELRQAQAEEEEEEVGGPNESESDEIGPSLVGEAAQADRPQETPGTRFDAVA